ncbi:GGDEF domain-containing protein [Paracoccaceae bacterium]|nr:GGDEF domain-containing protein [Paracoccaceae bacterium]
MYDCDDMWNTLCPMHLRLDSAGVFVHVGPTLAKLQAGIPFCGQSFHKVFTLLGSHADLPVVDLLARPQVKLSLRLLAGPKLALKGVLVPTPMGAVLNLSFGISIVTAVREHALTGTDFAATDLAMEMLYLVEAKSVAMGESRKLNARLQETTLAAQEEAFTDSLTGLKNRRAMDHIMDQFLASEKVFALMHLDLDRFKLVNDTFGHAAGDHVLQHAALIMLAQTRKEDAVLRVGGDDFILIFPGVTDLETLDAMADRLIRALEKPIESDGRMCKISGSVGIALATDYAVPAASQLLADADTALYAAKNAGGAQHRFFSKL